MEISLHQICTRILLSSNTKFFILKSIPVEINKQYIDIAILCTQDFRDCGQSWNFLKESYGLRLTLFYLPSWPV